MKGFSLALPVLAVAAATPAVAQVVDKRSAAIEEVIVTARKIEEFLQDTPVSVAVFSSADLEQMGVNEARDIPPASKCKNKVAVRISTQ